MTPDVVVDVGNSRMKWGRCLPTIADGGMVSLPPDDLNGWDDQAAAWGIGPGAWWAVAGVNPTTIERFTGWVRSTGGTSVVFRRNADLPIAINVEEPEAVGIDRLLGAVAAKAMVPAGTPAITIDVGTAVTVNLIDAAGVFQGGAIFPGPRLMALALHQHTARLPAVELTDFPTDPPPAKSTAAAIRLGIASAIGGGVMELASVLADASPTPPWLFLTGGGHHLLSGYRAAWIAEWRIAPELNLEGIRLAAEGLP